MLRRWLKIGAGVGLGATSIVALFAILVSVFSMEIIDITGNFSCVGSYDNPCISHFVVKNGNPYVVDIYSKDQVKLEFSPEIVDYALFVPDKRCTATGSCRCDLKDGSKIGFDDWRCVDFTNKTKPRTDKVYNFRFPAYSKTEFKLIGIKTDPGQKVKWGFGTGEAELDPEWQGIDLVESVRIDTSQFSGYEIRQTEIDNDYPCYLKKNGKVKCDKIKTPGKDALEAKHDLKDGIPITDYREMQYDVNKATNESVLLGYKKIYLDHNKVNEIDLGTKEGMIEIGFASNVFQLTNFNYGTDVNTSTDVTVELINTHADSDSYIILWLQMGNADNSTHAIDSSGSENHSTISGATHTHEHYEFDGINDKITIPDGDQNLTNFTVSMWVKVNAPLGKELTALDTDDGSAKNRFLIQQHSSNKWGWRVRLFGGGTLYNVFSDVLIVRNEWTHLVGIYNFSHTFMYVNGVLQSDIENPGLGAVSMDSNSNLRIGAAIDDSIWWNGSIDEVIIYNRNLTAAEVLALYNKGLYTKTGNFTSAIKDAPSTVNWGQLQVNISEPTGTGISFYTRGMNISKPNLTNSNLIAMWSLNQTNTNSDKNESGDAINDINGTKFGGDTMGMAFGHFEGENSTYFDGINDHINITLDERLNFTNITNFTITGWFKTNVSSGGYIFMKRMIGSPYVGYMMLFVSGKLEYRIDANTMDSRASSSAFTYTDNNWHHFAATFNSNYSTAVMELYVEGELVNYTDVSNLEAFNNSNTLKLGTDRAATGNFFNGSLAYIAIYNITLGSDEILKIGQWQACSLDVTHRLCTIQSPDSRYIQTQAVLSTTDAPSNVTPILGALNYTYDTGLTSGKIRFQPFANYSNSLWMLDFGIGTSVSVYNESQCGLLLDNVSINNTIHKKGSYALSYNAQNSASGRQDKQRLTIFNWPRRFYSNSYRIFFRMNATLTANVSNELDLNVSEILERTSSTTSANTSTFRLYRVNSNGGIYNDTNYCYEYPVQVE